MSEDTKAVVLIGSTLALAVALLVALWLAISPVYGVWSARKDGEAVLAHAHAARMVLVTQAEAEREAAVKRAEAIKIVGQAAKDFPEYRTQEFIGAFAEALREGKMHQVIYVPTEANIPITESRRLPKEEK